MSIRLPRNLTGVQGAEPIDALRHEIIQEMASSLVRATETFEQALAALAAVDRQEDAAAQDAASRRERLVADAGAALWAFVVQREACGLRNTEAVLRDYGVPAEVRLRMGVVRRDA